MKKTISAVAPQRARAILNTMGESGAPPLEGLELVTVGLEEYLQVIEEEYLGRLLGEAGGSAFRLVQGSYGAGKTHFLSCVRSLAQRHGFLTCSVNLSPRECPYQDALRVYQVAWANLSWRYRAGQRVGEGLNAEAEGEELQVRGAEAILRLIAQGQVESELAGPWGEIPVENYTFRRVAGRLVEAYRQGREEEAELLEHWLSGQAGSDRQLLRQLGIYDEVASDNAFPILRSLVALMTALGFPGVVFLFDEVDIQISSANAQQMRAIGDNLRQLIDLCASSRLGKVIFFYATPPEFMQVEVSAYPALQQRLARPLNMSKASPQSVVIDLEGAQREPATFFKELGLKLLDLAQIAWSWDEPQRELQEANLGRLVDFMSQQVFSGGYRLFVKFWLALLQEQYALQPHPLTEERCEELLHN